MKTALLTSRALLFALGLPLLATASILLRPAPRVAVASAPQTPPPLLRQGCPLRPEDRLSFTVQLQERSATHLGSKPVGELALQTRTTIHLRVLTGEADHALAVARLTDFSLQDRAGKQIPAGDISPPFLMKIRPDCAIEAVGQHRDAEARGARVQQAMARLLDWRIEGEQRSYEARQRDGVGEFSLRYGHGHHQGAEVVQRRMTEILALWPRQEQIRGQVLRSSGEATLGAGPWFDRAHEEQVIDVQRGTVTQRIERLLDIAKITPPEQDPFADVELDRTSILWRDRLEDAMTPPVAHSEAQKGRPIEEVLNEALTFEQANRLRQGHHSSARLLADFLRANPAAATVLAGRIRAGTLPKELRAPAALALSLADTPEARAALVSVIQDPGVSFEDRLRTIHATATTAHAGPEEARVLRKLASDPQQRDAARVATLALGTLAGKQKTSQPALAGAIREEIRDQLSRERDPQRLLDLLGAAGNAASEDLQQAIEPFGSHRDPSLRAAAFGALGSIDTPEARERQLSWLESETDPEARRTMWHEEAQRQGRPSPETLALASRRLSTETDRSSARLLIELLGRALDDEGARQALLSRLRTEQDPSLLQLLGRFLPASELP
jgi:hypothetical protein